MLSRIDGAVGEFVAEAREPIVHVLGSRRDLVAAVVELVLALVTVIEDRVVVALIDDQEPIVAECCVELGERTASIAFIE